jgi:hypothetical protein
LFFILINNASLKEIIHSTNTTNYNAEHTFFTNATKTKRKINMKLAKLRTSADNILKRDHLMVNTLNYQDYQAVTLEKRIFPVNNLIVALNFIRSGNMKYISLMKFPS